MISRKQFSRFMKELFSNFRLTLFAVLVVLTIVYILMPLFSSQIGDFVDRNQFLNYGFWGLGLLFFLFLAFLVNVFVLIYNSFRSIKRLRDLLYPVLVASFSLTMAFWFFTSTDSDVKGPFLYKLYMTFWIAYFSFIPQAFIYTIFPDHKPIKGFLNKVYYIVPRVALAAVIVYVVIGIHSELGRAFGITPD